MPHKFIVYPYKMISESAKDLARGLGAKRVFPDGRYRPKANHIIINWGNSQWPTWLNNTCTCLNKPSLVAQASNKLKTFNQLTHCGVSTPDWTTDSRVANSWGTIVFGRKKLTGHSGQGILIFDPAYPYSEGGLYPVPDRTNSNATRDICPLYTKYTKCKYEYRVHVFQGHIIDFVRKKKREGIEANQYIRSCDNGWVFCREGVELPECVKEQALKAIQALGLDFGAVDVGYNTRENKAYVYEVNSAPGLQGTTLTAYTNAFKELLI